MNPSAPQAPPAAYGTERRAENLAFVFQEVFTVAERLRSNRQPVTDANICGARSSPIGPGSRCRKSISAIMSPEKSSSSTSIISSA